MSKRRRVNDLYEQSERLSGDWESDWKGIHHCFDLQARGHRVENQLVGKRVAHHDGEGPHKADHCWRWLRCNFTDSLLNQPSRLVRDALSSEAVGAEGDDETKHGQPAIPVSAEGNKTEAGSESAMKVSKNCCNHCNRCNELRWLAPLLVEFESPLDPSFSGFTGQHRARGAQAGVAAENHSTQTTPHERKLTRPWG